MITMHTQQTGYSLIEVLVAISILLVVIAGPMTIAARSIQYAYNAGMETTAFFLAQEGIEYMTAARNTWAVQEFKGTSGQGWRWSSMGGHPMNACIRNGSSDSGKWCGIDTNGTGSVFTLPVRSCSANSTSCRLNRNTQGFYTHAAGDPTEFSRYVNVQRVNNYIYLVTSRVVWETRGGGTKEIILENYLYDII